MGLLSKALFELKNCLNKVSVFQQGVFTGGLFQGIHVTKIIIINTEDGVIQAEDDVGLRQSAGKEIAI